MVKDRAAASTTSGTSVSSTTAPLLTAASCKALARNGLAGLPDQRSVKRSSETVLLATRATTIAATTNGEAR